MVIDEVYRILQYAFDNKLTIKEAITKLNVNVKYSTRKDGKFRCNHCKRNFTCKVGTIFEDRNLSLVKWFIAMYLISSHKKGIQEKWLNQSDSAKCSIPLLD